jgi:hypothetical protein
LIAIQGCGLNVRRFADLVGFAGTVGGLGDLAAAGAI